MTDIVERLRACQGILTCDPECVCTEAADEIDRLRVALRELLTANERIANSANGGDFGEVVGPAAEKAYAVLRFT